MRSFANGVAGLLAATIVAGSVVIFCAHFSEAFWLFDLIGQFLLPVLWGLMACSLGLVLLSLFSRSHGTNVLFAVFALAFVAVGWARIWPSPDPPMPVGAKQVTVYQHNVWARNQTPERVIQGALDSQADIVVLAEAESETFAPFEAQLKAQWPYQVHKSGRVDRETRLRLLSRYEILEQSLRAADNAPAILRARLATPGGEVTVLVVHFTRPWPFNASHAQLRQLAGLQAELARIDGPVILLGDFNSAGWGRTAAPLKQQGFRLLNDPRFGTWPTRVPHRPGVASIVWPSALAIPIDLAFCRGAVWCGNHVVGEAFGSDHRSAAFTFSLASDAISDKRRDD